MEELRERWKAAHEATLPLIQQLAAPEPPSAAAAAARLPPGVLDGATLAAALAREEAARRSSPCAAKLSRNLEALEVVLDEMHALARDARDAVAALPLASAAERGNLGLLLSPADRAMAVAAPLRCYEAELALKRYIADAVQQPVPPPRAQIDSLLVAWQCQPMLEPLTGMRAADEQQRLMEAAGGADEEGRRDLSRRLAGLSVQ